MSLLDSDHHVDSVDRSDWVDAQADLCLCWTHKAQSNRFIAEQLLFSGIKKKNAAHCVMKPVGKSRIPMKSFQVFGQLLASSPEECAINQIF